MQRFSISNKKQSLKAFNFYFMDPFPELKFTNTVKNLQFLLRSPTQNAQHALQKGHCKTPWSIRTNNKQLV